MTTQAQETPAKPRVIQNHIQDSTRWDTFEYRDDDIVIATWSKTGTTWMQQIVSQLLHNGDPEVCPNVLSPWLDMRVAPLDEILGLLNDQKQRRFIKTHLPADALPWNPTAEYIFIARDVRDTIWSLHHHFSIGTSTLWQLLNEYPGRVGPPMSPPPADPRGPLTDLLEDDTRPTIPWPFWSLMRSWWALRDQPNVLLVHFGDMKKDLDGEMKRIAAFLGVDGLTDSQWKGAVEHSGFDWMKEHADRFAPPQAEAFFEGGAKQFINKGTNNRWANALSEEDNKKFATKVEQELGTEFANWLENGRLGK